MIDFELPSFWILCIYPFFPKSDTMGNSEARLELWSPFFSSSPQPLDALCAETCFLWNSALGLNYGLG